MIFLVTVFFFIFSPLLDMLGGGLFTNKAVTAPANPNKDFEVTQPPDDTVSVLEFSPATMQQNFLIAGSWDNSVS
jgi:mRNA export factor